MAWAVTPIPPLVQASPGIALAGDTGTLGVGGQASLGFKPWLDGRLSVHALRFTTTLNVGGLDYDSAIRLGNVGAYADVHPAFSDWRLSLGLLYNDNRVDLHRDCGDGCTVNGMVVAGPNVQLDGSLSFNRLAPYLGVGWNSSPAASSTFVSFDAGVMFQGAPKVALNASGIADVVGNGFVLQGVNLQTDPLARSTLDDERTQLRNDVHAYRYFPVVSLSVGHRFF